MLKMVSIDEVQTGMFLVAICRQKGHQKVSKPGHITMEHKGLLKNKGISKVMIDPARTLASKAENEPVVEQADKPATVDNEQKALRTFQQAKNVQYKYFNQLKKGEPIDIAPLREAADELVSSLDNYSDALLCLARIREKDAYLMEHSLNVGMLLAYFGRSTGMSRSEQGELLVGGMLHDVGKVKTPDEVLHKPGRLTDDEFAIMRQHVVHSRNILSVTPGISDLMLEVASNHHERIDGKGYPNGIGEVQMSECSRMSGIVDCYDALTADRVYKSGMPPTSAFGILMQGAGTQFDKSLVQQFIRCMGVYPSGTWVKLASGKIGLVIKRNMAQPLKPVVRVVYSTNTHAYIPVKEIDLSKFSNEVIESAVSAQDYDIDVRRFTLAELQAVN